MIKRTTLGSGMAALLPPNGPVVTFAKATHEGWKILESIRSIPYSSNYWGSRINGIFPLNIHHGGIRDRYIPRDEKIKLRNYLRTECKMPRDFIGIVSLEVIEGNFSHIRIISNNLFKD